MDAKTFDQTVLWHYRAKLIRVIDGDTCAILADTGYSGRHEVHVRLAGFSAPETYEPGGAAATVRLMKLVQGGVGDWPLRVITLQRETVVSEVRSFERYVGRLYVVTEAGVLIDVAETLRAESAA